MSEHDGNATRQPTPESRSYEPPAAEELPDEDRMLETAPGFVIVTGGDTD